MSVVQEAFFIPDDIATGLATGLYRRIGSVVRYASGPHRGRIVKHLKTVNIKAAEETQGLGMKALQFVNQHKKGTLIAVAGASVVGAGALVYNKVKNHEPKVETEFKKELKIYLEAIKNGSMDIDKINELMVALEKLKQHKDYEKISIQLTADEIEVIVSRIYEYTIKLAKDNEVELSDEELNTAQIRESGAIINLQNYLKAQKRIFEFVA